MIVSFAAVVVVVTVTVLGALVSIGTIVMPPAIPVVVSLAMPELSFPEEYPTCDEEPDAMAGSVSEEEDESEAVVGEPAPNELEAAAGLVWAGDPFVVDEAVDWMLEDVVLPDAVLDGDCEDCSLLVASAVEV